MVDQMVRAIAADGGIRIVGVITTHLTEEARQRHQLSPVATAALGQTMASGLLLASSMKQAQSRVSIRVQGDGPLNGITVDAGLNGTVRGFVGNPAVDVPLNTRGKLDVGGAVGNEGFLRVMRDVGYGDPYSGTVELVSGEIGEDISYYLVASEQTPSALVVGVFVGADGVTAAGGLLVQVLPKASRDESLVEKLESRLSEFTEFTPLLQAGEPLPQIFEELVGDMGLQIFPDTQELRFQCRCSFDRVLSALKMLGEAELHDIITTDGEAEANCHFCGTVYKADRDQLEALIQEIQLDQAAG
jgi:molecular chaperone Hsp33